MVKVKDILERCECKIIFQGRIVDWPDIRDMVDITSGSTLSPSKLDTTAQQLVNRLHKKAPELLARD